MKNKKIINMLISFFLPIILFLIVMYLRVGEIDGNYILISDMEAQYNSLFQYLKNVLNGNESLFYSFHKGLGGEMFTAFTYYLSSPLNLLVFFFEDGQIPNCILLIILIKLGLCGLNMNIYLSYKNRDKTSTNFIFSLCYALMSYTVNYYFNIMWLDAVYMLPIVMLGLDKLIDKQKPLLYIIALSYTIICNYYVGYMVCLFVLIYYIYQIISKGKKVKKNIVMFILSSILSAGIASFILIPTIMQIPKLASTQGDISINLEYIVKVVKGILENLIIGSHNCSNTTNPYGIYIYSTNFCLVLSIIFFLNKNINKKKKVLTSIVLIIFLFSFTIMPITYIWHGFSTPAYFNGRNSFLLSFFIIILAYDSFINVKNIKNKDMLYIFVIYLIISLLCIILKINYIQNIIVGLIFIILYVILLYSKNNNCFKWILIGLIIIEVFVNLYMAFVSKTIMVSTYKDYLDDICSTISNNDVNNYRLENLRGSNGIDGVTCGYSNSTTFLSTITSNDISFFSNYGYFGGGKLYQNIGSNTDLIDSILGIKYYYATDELYKKDNLIKSDLCNKIKVYDENENILEDEYCLYYNPDSLKLGYVVKNINTKISNNVFENQNELIKAMTGYEENALHEIQYDEYSDNKYKIVNNNRPFYFYFINSEMTETVVYANGKEIYRTGIQRNIDGMILKVFSSEEITEIEIKSGNDINVKEINFYQIDEKVQDLTLDMLHSQEISVYSINKSTLEADLVVEENGYLLLTIPYNNNFKLYIDDKIVDIEEAYEYFISTPITAGKHTIKLIYNKKIYYISAIISAIFIICTYFFVKKCKKII